MTQSLCSENSYITTIYKSARWLLSRDLILPFLSGSTITVTIARIQGLALAGGPQGTLRSSKIICICVIKNLWGKKDKSNCKKSSMVRHHTRTLWSTDDCRHAFLDCAASNPQATEEKKGKASNKGTGAPASGKPPKKSWNEKKEPGQRQGESRETEGSREAEKTAQDGIKMSYRTESPLDNSFSGSIIAYNPKQGNSYKYSEQYRNLPSIWLSWSWTRVVRIQGPRNSMDSPWEIQNTK